MPIRKSSLIERLFRDHGKSLRRFLVRRLGNEAEAEEIAQEALLRLHQLDDHAELDDARAFLFQVASNMAIDQLRRRALQSQHLREETEHALDEQELETTGRGESPEEIAAAQERLAAIYQAIESMPENWRNAFLLHRVRGLSYNQIAKSMDVSVSSVEKYILEALKYLRQNLPE